MSLSLKLLEKRIEDLHNKEDDNAKKLDAIINFMDMKFSASIGYSISEFINESKEKPKNTIFRIWCEWDMGFPKACSSREVAQKLIDEFDWLSCGIEGTSKELQKGGMVGIEKIEIYDEK